MNMLKLTVVLIFFNVVNGARDDIEDFKKIGEFEWKNENGVDHVSKYYLTSPIGIDLDFESSRTVCKNANMKLVELETKEEHDAILKIFKKKQRFLKTYHYLGAQSNDLGEWKWISGGKLSSEINLEVFESYEDDGSCIKYSTRVSKYYRYTCGDDVSVAICEKEVIKNPDEPVDILEDFEILGEFEWKDQNGDDQVSKYYLNEPDDYVDFEASQTTCKNVNLKLVELETKEEFDAILQIFENTHKSVHDHYLGAHANDLGEWKWMNGDKFSYEMNLQAYDSEEEEDFCIQFGSSALKYYAYTCTKTLIQVVCEKEEKKIAGDDKNANVESTTRLEDTTEGNSDGFKNIGQFEWKNNEGRNQVSKYYLKSFEEKSKNFEASQAVCENANMKLVALETKEEFDAILQIFKNKYESLGSTYFLGGQLDNLRTEWKWVSGEKFSYRMNLEPYDSEENQGFCILYYPGSLSYYSNDCTYVTSQVVCENVSSIESPTTKYIEPEETTEFYEPEPDGTEYSGILNRILNITEGPIKPKYSYSASVYFLILAGVFILVALWQMIYCCCC